MSWIHDNLPHAARTLVAAFASLVGMALAVPHFAIAAEPPTEPVLRIEAEMHGAMIRAVATDAAQRYVVTGSLDKTVRVWDLASGRLLRILRPPLGPGNEGKINAVAMSPDGSTVAAAGWTGYDWDRTASIYLFDRATAQIKRRIAGLPGIALRLVWSPDGSLLAAGLSDRNGIRVFRAQDGSEIGADTAYGNRSESVDFHHTGNLLSTSFDGFLRVYRVSERALTLIAKKKAPGGAQPFFARFSPDGSRIAVGYQDSARVDVLSGGTLALLYSPDTHGVKNGDLSKVAWSADGSLLYAGGRYGVGVTTRVIRVWTQAGQGSFQDLLAAASTIGDIAPLAAGGIVYGTFDPLLGTFDGAGRKIWERRAPFADVREIKEGFKVSRDGTIVDFAFEPRAGSPARIDVTERRLDTAPAVATGLAAPVTSAPGLDLRDWYNGLAPTLNGQPLTLQQYEISYAVAIAPDRQSFIVGAQWYLRRFDTQGKEIWRIPAPETTWAVNVSGDGKIVVAAYGDGTIRWYRLSDGTELLTFFPHADRKRWVLWSPSGYYDASPGAEDLIGWHLNRGKDVAADFYPVSRFRSTFYRPDVVAKALESLDERTALRLANEDARRKTQAVEVAKTLPPVVQIVAPTDGAAVSTPEVRVRFTVRTASDAPIIAVRARVNGQAVNLGEARNIVVGGTADAARELAIPVPRQDSEIMVFAENRHGVSVPAMLHVRWAGAAPPTAGAEFIAKPKLYILAVGVSAYQDAKIRLQFAAKDARDFSQAMLRQKNGLYRDVEVKLVTDAQATRDNVVDGLEWLQRQVTSKDVGMLFLAGHGVNDANSIYHFLPVNFTPDAFKRTGIPFSDIRNTLASLAGKALFFVDTCHSGDVMGGRRAGPSDIVGALNELASAENGVVVFSSSTGRQYSLESAEWNNGAFTKALVEGITGQADVKKTGRVTHKMLDLYIAERVKQLTKGQQSPVNTSPQGVPDFPIALTGR
jgi:WD40 repeat protein